ncbi:MAG: pilus assembly protein [Clostridiales bacterium]|nr:MAG: pilus assembly protein [Clostridiales bacterium]
MVEYALIIGGIALIAMVGINLLGPGLDTLFNEITAAIA